MLLARTGRRVSELCCWTSTACCRSRIPPTNTTATATRSSRSFAFSRPRSRARRTRSSSTRRLSRSSAPSRHGCTHGRAGRCCATRPRRRRATCSSPRGATTGPPPLPQDHARPRLQAARRADGHPRQPRPPGPRVSNVHRFRHTRATSLINAGVPVHVVQRYLGHLSPRMTMHYAKTLRETHEREFLRYKKITADGAGISSSTRAICSR